MKMLAKTFLHVLALMFLSASAVLVWIRSRRPDGKPWLPFLTMQASLLSFLLALSIQELGWEPGIKISSIFGFLGVEGVIASVYALLRITFRSPKRFIVSLVYSIAIVSVAVSFILWVSGIPFLAPLGIMLQFAALVNLIVEGWLRRKECTDRLLARILGDAVAIGLPALPLLIIDPLGSTMGWALPEALIGNYSLPLFFLALNALTTFRIASWMGRTDMGEASVSRRNWDALGLSPREGEVAALLLEGKSAKDIAKALGISPKTVENHSYRIFQKLGVSTRFEFLGRYKQNL